VAQEEAEKKGTEADHYQHHLESELETAQHQTKDLLSQVALSSSMPPSGDTTPCRMTGVTLHSDVHYTELEAAQGRTQDLLSLFFFFITLKPSVE